MVPAFGHGGGSPGSPGLSNVCEPAPLPSVAMPLRVVAAHFCVVGGTGPSRVAALRQSLLQRGVAGVRVAEELLHLLSHRALVLGGGGVGHGHALGRHHGRLVLRPVLRLPLRELLQICGVGGVCCSPRTTAPRLVHHRVVAEATPTPTGALAI